MIETNRVLDRTRRFVGTFSRSCFGVAAQVCHATYTYLYFCLYVFCSLSKHCHAYALLFTWVVLYRILAPKNDHAVAWFAT